MAPRVAEKLRRSLILDGLRLFKVIAMKSDSAVMIMLAIAYITDLKRTLPFLRKWASYIACRIGSG